MNTGENERAPIRRSRHVMGAFAGRGKSCGTAPTVREGYSVFKVRGCTALADRASSSPNFSFFGFHSRANFCASAIWAGVIMEAAMSLLAIASFSFSFSKYYPDRHSSQCCRRRHARRSSHQTCAREDLLPLWGFTGFENRLPVFIILLSTESGTRFRMSPVLDRICQYKFFPQQCSLRQEFVFSSSRGFSFCSIR